EVDGRAGRARSGGAQDGSGGGGGDDREGRRAGAADGAGGGLVDQAGRGGAVVVPGGTGGGRRGRGGGGGGCGSEPGPSRGPRGNGVGLHDGAGQRDGRAFAVLVRHVVDGVARGGIAAADRDVAGELRHGADADGSQERAGADARRHGDGKAEAVGGVGADR